MRMLHVLTEPRGGGGAYALALAEAVRLRGDDVRFLAPRPLAPNEDFVPLRPSRTRDVIAACRAGDLVHLHGIRSGLLRPLIGSKAAKVLTTHGLHKLRSERGWQRPLVRAVTRFALRGVDAIVCTSEAELVDVAQLDPALREKACVVLNGVPAAPLPSREQRAEARQRLGLEQDDPVLLFVGGLRYQKNPALAVDAVRLARQRLRGLVLLIAGEGPLEVELLQTPHDGWLRLLGVRTDVADLLAAADAVLNTSRWEGLSLALLEALWRGRPAVVTDAPGNPEAVGEAGLVVGQDAHALADAIVKMFAVDSLLTRLGQAARTRAESLYDQRRMIAETVRVYDDVLRRRPD